MNGEAGGHPMLIRQDFRHYDCLEQFVTGAEGVYGCEPRDKLECVKG